MKQLKQTKDDLDYLAELGLEGREYAFVDVQKLRNNIRSETGGFNSHSGFAFVCFACGAFLAVTIVFSLRNSQTGKPVTNYAAGGRSVSLNNHVSGLVMLDTVLVQEELFEKPVHLNKHKPSLGVAADLDTSVISLEAVTTVVLPDPTIDTKELKHAINTPVRFIHDLKVSNYAVLYFRKNNKAALRGTPAESSGEEANAVQLNDQANEFLHQRLAEGLYYFKKEKYPEAKYILGEVASYNTEDVNCDFYIGMSNYFQKSYENAILSFDKCLSASNNAFSEESLYYKALCLNKLGKEDEAEKLLRRIISEKGFYSEKARKELSAL